MTYYSVRFIVTLVSIVIVVLLAWVIGVTLEPKNFDNEIETFFSVDRLMFLPESAEKLQYIFILIAFPIVLLLMVRVLNNLQERSNLIKKINESSKISDSVFFGTILVVFYLTWYGLDRIDFVYFKNYYLYEKPQWSLSFLVAIYVLYVVKKRVDNKYETNKITTGFAVTILDIIIYISIVVSSQMYVFSIHNIRESGLFTSHFNAVFHSVAAVVSGKSLLVDEINQYGLYPHFIEPIFRVVDLNVRSFALVLSILILITFLCWYFMLRRILSNRLIAQVGFITVLFFGYLQFKLQSEDPYFQYYPIRTIFPALLILMSSGYFLNEKRYKYLAISIVCSLAVLWNAETGIIVLLSWIGAVVYNAPIG